MKKETIEEEYLNQLIDEANKEWTMDYKLAKEVARKFTKWHQENSNINVLYLKIDALTEEIKLLKYQQERSYSEEEVFQIINLFDQFLLDNEGLQGIRREIAIEEWFEQFKKK